MMDNSHEVASIMHRCINRVMHTPGTGNSHSNRHQGFNVLTIIEANFRNS